jgi:hypothetical protein
MGNRLQVILKDHEYREIQRMARACRMSVAERVRQALPLARRRESGAGAGKKLEVIRAAARHDFPSGDIGSRERIRHWSASLILINLKYFRRTLHRFSAISLVAPPSPLE